MTAPTQIAHSAQPVKKQLLSLLSNRLDALFSASPRTGKQMEESVWEVVTEVGAATLASMAAMACWAATERETCGQTGTHLRLDRDYWISQQTTFGPIRVPLFAYRDSTGRTHSPAKAEVFPLHPHCRSSELCLEWENRLGGQLPFRQAQDALRFFSHGVTRVEDSTIARHTAVVGGLLDREWTYRRPEDIAEVLQNRATRDTTTGRPLLYFSTDAHALRRFVDDSYTAKWKMINGIRMWCIDQRTAKIIHLGGEYTWGDCREVGERFCALIRDYVPAGKAAPQLVLLTDGMPWITDHVASQMPEDTVFILDFYHAVQNVAAYAATRFGKESTAAKAWLSLVRAQLFGKRGYTRPTRKRRKGPRAKKSKKKATKRTIHLSENRHGAGEALANQLLDEAQPHCLEAHSKLLGYVSENAHRMDYPTFRERGIQVGSGAMESFHITASQMRLKLSGARWLPQTAIAVLNTRLMLLAGRWSDFWNRPDLAQHLRQAFAQVHAA